MEKLQTEPCPRCGNTNPVCVKQPYFHSTGYKYRCTTCGANIDTQETKEKALETWNRLAKKQIPDNLEPIRPCRCDSHEIIKLLNPKLVQTVQGKSTLFYVECPICGLDTILYKKAENAVYEWNHYFAKDSQGDLLELQERRNKINKEETNR